MSEKNAVITEVKWRFDLLSKLGGKVANYGIHPTTLRNLRVYGGQQGIWVDKQRTARLTGDGNGLAVSLLRKGMFYSDDLDETGVIYHYPATSRPQSRDSGDIEAVKNCGRFNVPLFVITVSEVDSSRRDVYFGYVTLWDDRARVFIVEFGIDRTTIASKEDDKPFELTVSKRIKKYEAIRRPDQAAFRITVFRRYGAQCAVCKMVVIELLEAAHLVSKAENGSDDPRNGLPFCTLHHRAFDKGLFTIRPDLSLVTKPHGPSGSELGITRGDLSHLKAIPHQNALSHCWQKWLKENGG